MGFEKKFSSFLIKEKQCLVEGSDYDPTLGLKQKDDKTYRLFSVVIIQVTGFDPISASLKALDKNMTMCNITHKHTHFPNGSTSHKAVSVNCAVKALKGMVDEIKLL